MIKFEVVVGDITQISVDAIVNAASPFLMGGAGVDGAIHRAAGPELRKECATLGGCEVGGAKTTKAYNLPAKYVIHAVGPCYRDYTDDKAKALLHQTYCSVLKNALDVHIETISIPAISCGIYAFPLKEAVKIATHTIAEYRSVPQGVCDGAPDHIDEWGLNKIIFVVSNEEIAEFYREEIKEIEAEQESWNELLGLLSNDAQDDNKDQSIKEITEKDIKRVEAILAKYPKFAKKDDNYALYETVGNYNPKAVEFIKILLKYGANIYAPHIVNSDFISILGPECLLKIAKCPEIKNYLISVGKFGN